MLIMISFSWGFDSAIRSVRATKVLSDSIFLLFLDSIICMRVEKEIKGVKIEKVELVSNTYHVYATRYDIRLNCCNKRMNIHDYRTVNIRSLGYGNRKVILHIEKQRYVCHVCGKRITSSIDIVDRNCTISNEVKDEIRRKLSEMKSFTQIGREENTSISTVMRIFHDIEVPKRKLDYEIKFGKHIAFRSKNQQRFTRAKDDRRQLYRRTD